MFRKFLAAAAAALAFLCTPACAQKVDLIEVIELNAVIDDGVAARITEQVEKINDNAKVKAVLLMLDTPGGGATASAVIYEELGKLKVPVVVWCQNLCASGGVYAAMAPSVKYIAVRSETIGGSVGVIAASARYNRLLEWAKIDSETYKSGALKDPWNPTRAATDSDRKFLQSIIDSLATKFYAVVAKARGNKINAAGWDEIKSARIFIGDDIVKIGLADTVATKAQVITKAKELSGSKNIFTRDELKKMSSQANEDHNTYKLTAPAVSAFGDVPFLIDLVKEIKSGESVKFEYRMPYKF